MIATIPANTTRPLFHIANHHGVDYATALNVAWGIKLQLVGEAPTSATNKALMDLRQMPDWPDAYGDILSHTRDFVASQGSNHAKCPNSTTGGQQF